MPKSIKDLNCCGHTYKVLLLLSNLLRVCVFWVGHLHSLELQITECVDSVNKHTHTDTNTHTLGVCQLNSFPVRQNKRIVSQCAEEWCQKHRCQMKWWKDVSLALSLWHTQSALQVFACTCRCMHTYLFLKRVHKAWFANASAVRVPVNGLGRLWQRHATERGTSIATV